MGLTDSGVGPVRPPDGWAEAGDLLADDGKPDEAMLRKLRDGGCCARYQAGGYTGLVWFEHTQWRALLSTPSGGRSWLNSVCLDTLLWAAEMVFVGAERKRRR